LSEVTVMTEFSHAIAGRLLPVGNQDRRRDRNRRQPHSASGAGSQRATRLMKARRRQPGDFPTKSVARQRMNIVEVDDAIAGNMILVDSQLQFRDQPTASPRQCRHHDSPNPLSHWIPGEDQNGSVAARGCGKP
jgi:hypothetical protein